MSVNSPSDKKPPKSKTYTDNQKGLTSIKNDSTIVNIGKVPYKINMRWILRKGVSKVEDIKNVMKTIPKFVSLTILAVGFIHSGIQLAESDIILTSGVVLLAAFLIKEASKQ